MSTESKCLPAAYPPSRLRRANRSAGGQALVETLVVALALVPLAVLVVLLGKYQSIQSATVAASRSLAFDCAARPQACSDSAAVGWLAEAVRLRHFSRPDRAVLSAERAGGTGGGAGTGSGSSRGTGSPGVGPGPAAIDRHPLWQDRAGRPLLERLEHVGATVGSQPFNAGLGTAIGRAGSADLTGIGVRWPTGDSPGGFGGFAHARAAASSGPAPAAAEVLDRLAGPARFGLAVNEGLLDARVEVSVASSFAGTPGFARLDPLAVSMRARTAVLGDSWQASGPHLGASSVAARVEAGARLDRLREARLTAGYQLTRWTLELVSAAGLESTASSFRYHEVDPELVPADRLEEP
jgi:hypothetical protein